jgi:hypothetical protein
MNETKLVPRWVAASAVVIGLIGGGYGIASAASGKSAATTTTTTTTTTPDRGHDHQRGDEAPLTGDVLASVSKAALAKEPGAKVVRAETDADGNALYEVHMTTTGGTEVTVYVDKSFDVVSVDTSDHGGPGHGRGPRGDETALTGDALSKATAAALAKEPSGKVLRAESDADGGSAYEVHMTDASGAFVTVHLDQSFAVTGIETGPQDGGPHQH